VHQGLDVLVAMPQGLEAGSLGGLSLDRAAARRAF